MAVVAIARAMAGKGGEGGGSSSRIADWGRQQHKALSRLLQNPQTPNGYQYRAVQVSTGAVPYQYITLHVSTGQYLISASHYKSVQDSTVSVHHTTWQYMAVPYQCLTWQYRISASHYKSVQGSTVSVVV